MFQKMPYPMAQSVTFVELKRILIEEYDCQFQEGPKLSLHSSDLSFTVTYFSRTVDGTVLECLFLPKSDDQRMLPDMIRYICERLQIPKRSFGLTLG
jgi:hypothetical protein